MPLSRTGEDTVGGVFALGLLLLVIVRGLPAAARIRRTLLGAGGDGAARLLELAVRGLPLRHAEWGEAMRAELGALGRGARRAFAAGCARAALVVRVRAGVLASGRGGNGVRALVLAAVGAAACLGLYGAARYPSLHAGAAAWAAIAAFVVILVLYGVGALSLTRGGTRRERVVRRGGAAGGLAIGAAWLAILAPGAFPKGLVLLPLAAALLVPACIAAFVTRSTGTIRAGGDAALWSGMVGALLAFVVWVPATYASDGRPYDPQLMRDFRHSGAHDLAAYAVGDTLGAALGLLVIVPVVALALGSLAARVAGARPG